VREPAPMSIESEHVAPDQPQPTTEQPQPVVVSTAETESTERPRRSGWWSRRVLGKD